MSSATTQTTACRFGERPIGWSGRSDSLAPACHEQSSATVWHGKLMPHGVQSYLLLFFATCHTPAAMRLIRKVVE